MNNEQPARIILKFLGDGRLSIKLEWPKDQVFCSKFWLKNRAS